MAIPGFFVDWNGDTRKTEMPGGLYKCVVDESRALVEVIDSTGFVVHEGTYFSSLESVEAAGVIVNLIS